MSTIELPDGDKGPQTTPQAERQRLVAKGKFLAEHCLSDGHTDCVLGFVEHCLGKSPPRLDVIVELWRDLRQDYERRLGTAEIGDEQRAELLQQLLQDMTSQLKEAVRRMTETA
jgi:hypothetical protein